MNPTTPTSAMSQGATFMRPGAMAWGQPGQAGQRPADPSAPVPIGHALAAAAKDPDQVTDLLDELSRGRLWLPLPEARPVTDGSAVLLPTVTYLGAEFVPAFTSAGRLASWLGQDPVPPFAAMPHIVVPRSEEHTSELQSQSNLVCRLLLEKKKDQTQEEIYTLQPVDPSRQSIDRD